MKARQSSGEQALITTPVSQGAHGVRTIETPAGSFRTIRKEVFDRAMRSANTALRQVAGRPVDAPADVRER